MPETRNPAQRMIQNHQKMITRALLSDLGLNETMVFEKARVRVTWVVPELVEWVVRR
jgi:hypothetical protein